MVRGKDRLDILKLELRRCAARQGRCIAGLQCGELGKLQEWAGDAQRSLDLFKQLFTGITPLGPEGKRRAELLTIFELIKSQGKELQKLSAVQSQRIAAEISRLRRGKMALQGYTARHQANAVKFLSGSG